VPADNYPFVPTSGECQVASNRHGIIASSQGAQGGFEKNGSPKRVVTVSVGRNVSHADERRVIPRSAINGRFQHPIDTRPANAEPSAMFVALGHGGS
jgi:hypothetical protein